jgi:hypothetical protein
MNGLSRAVLALSGLMLAGCIVNQPPTDTTHVVVQPEMPAPSTVVVPSPPPPTVIVPTP